MRKNLPVVNVAVACEKILAEKDDVLSMVRIIDTYFVPTGSAAPPPDTILPISGLVVLRAADFIGEGELWLVLVTPDGKRTDPQKIPMIFRNLYQANNVICNFGIQLRHIGVSWIEVIWEGETLTKFPIRLEPAKKPDEKTPAK